MCLRIPGGIIGLIVIVDGLLVNLLSRKRLNEATIDRGPRADCKCFSALDASYLKKMLTVKVGQGALIVACHTFLVFNALMSSGLWVVLGSLKKLSLLSRLACLT